MSERTGANCDHPSSDGELVWRCTACNELHITEDVPGTNGLFQKSIDLARLDSGMVIVPESAVPDQAVIAVMRFAVNILDDLVEWSNDGDEWASECLQEMRNNMAIVGNEIHEMPPADEMLALIKTWLDAQEGRP